METESAHDRIVQARVDFLMGQPFYGQLAVRLSLVEADSWCPTMAVDGIRMYYNTEFVNGLSDDELKFVVAHEVMHCVYQHFLRREQRNPRLWNCAGDYVINLELSDLEIGRMPKASSMPNWEEDRKIYDEMGVGPNDAGGLIDEAYRGMVSEEVYEILLKDAEENGKHANENVKNWDIHLDPESSDGGDGDGPVQMSPEEVDLLKDELKKAVIDAAKAADEMTSGAGKIPGGVRRLIKQWTESKVDWKSYLANTILSTVKNDYTWQRSSRKGRDQGIYLPGIDNDDQVSVHVAIDTSGSIWEDDIRAFLAEVRGIMDQFSDFKIVAWCFDTKTYDIHEYTPDNEDEIEDFVVKGGGGTLFECNWDMMKEEDIIPDTFIVFTDGCPFGSWGDPDYADTIFLIKGNPNREAPFGVTVHYEQAETQ